MQAKTKRTAHAILPQSFFNRPTLVVARELLGKYIVRTYRGREIALMITEIEAYDGPNDRASHARFGRAARNGRLPRASIMWGEAGWFYVYFTYGIHWLVNVITGPVDYPAAILIRAGTYRNPKTGANIPIIGPARLTKFMHIAAAQNRTRATRDNGLWFEDRGVRISRSRIITSRRIGIDYAGPMWAAKEWNFKLKP